MAKTIVDSKLAWAICLASFWMLMFIHGVVRSSGVFYATMVEMWDLTREEVSWPFNLCAALDGVGVFLTGISTVTFIARRGAPIAVLAFFVGMALSSFTQNIPLLILLIGLIGGLSQGYMIGTCLILMCHYFHQSRTLATGISISGSSVGGILFPYLYNYLIQEYGLSTSFLLSAAISSHALIGAVLCRLLSMIDEERNQRAEDVSFNEKNFAVAERTSGDPEQANCSTNIEITQETRREERKCSLELKSNRLSKIMQFVKNKLSVMKHPMFYIYAFSFTVTNFCNWSWIIILVDFAKDRGITQTNASYLLSIASVADLVGRVLYGWFMDFGFVTKRTALIVLFLCISLNSFLVILFYSFVLLCVSSAVCGFLGGCFITNRAVVPAAYFGLEDMQSVIGLTGLTITGLSLLRPSLIGFIRDTNGSYDDMFLIFGALVCVGGSLWLFENLAMKFHNRTISVEQSNEREKIRHHVTNET